MRAWLLILLVAASGCSAVLGLREGKVEGSSCSSDDDCEPGRRCFDDRCEDDGSMCTGTVRRCDGLQPQECRGGRWVDDGSHCTESCATGECVPRPSCDATLECGDKRASCCEAIEVRGGTFYLRSDSRDRSHPRRVSPFVLDRFEVTVGRFRKFARAYLESNLPEDGAGAHPKIEGSGWQAAWNGDRTLLKSNDRAIDAQLQNCGDWGNEIAHDLPVRCVNWYTAFAFCIWDGGRLPTEAEWQFAAAGGNMQRVYPWSEGDRDDSIYPRHACFNRPFPERVGTHPDGRGPYGHDDLAGNVSEWVLDYYREDLSDETCRRDDVLVDCAELGPTCCRGLKGGSFRFMEAQLKNAYPNGDEPARWEETHGFRCARDPG